MESAGDPLLAKKRFLVASGPSEPGSPFGEMMVKCLNVKCDPNINFSTADIVVSDAPMKTILPPTFDLGSNKNFLEKFHRLISRD